MRTKSLFLLLMLFASSVSAAEQKQPNILFIFADDQCFETLAASGHPVIKTPNLDRLTRQGTTFTHAFNMGSWSGAVCVASRCMLNTGRFIWRANAVYRETGKELQAGRFWSSYLRNAGYHTYMTGKWHVRADATKAFDTTSHIRGGMPNQVPEGYNRPLSRDDKTWLPYDPQWGGFWKDGKHWSEVVADDAIGFLDQSKADEDPFFMYIAFNAPHDPRQSPKEYVDLYPLEEVDVPVNFLEEYPYNEAAATGRKLRDEMLAPFPRTEYSVKVNRQEYYAIITHMDYQIGRILEHLKETKQDRNTYIVFTADHGLAVGHHGLMGKQNMYEHSVRVPFIVVGPGVAKGANNDANIYLQDVMPTTLELAGVEKPEHVEFNSLLPLLSGRQKESNYPAVYGAYLESQRSVRAFGYKMILYPEVGKVRLYNLDKDPLEQTDLSGDTSTAEVQKRLFAELQKLQKEMGDQLDLTGKFSL
ncbi:MAG: sulfatase-like hydrolase/transferase [Planctomycetota bacterium]|nr:sulfatase-like hydrolase/transferase [Planctomycetota bacterium]